MMSFYLFLLIVIFNNFGLILCNNQYYYYNSQYLYKRERTPFIPLFSAPKILFDNSVATKFRDDTFQLNCNASGNPTAVIKWFKNSLNNKRYSKFSLVSQSEIYTINSDGSLTFSNASPNISANYFCSATNIFGTVFSRKSVVQSIHLPKNIRVSCQTKDIIPYEKAVFECIIDPNMLTNDFTVKRWHINMKHGPPLIITKTDSRFSVINATKVPQLHVRNVTKEDFSNMQVKCVLVNRFEPNFLIDSSNWVRPKEYIYEIYGSNHVHDTCKGSEISVMQGSLVELPWCSYPTTLIVTWYKSNTSTDLTGVRVRIDGHKFRLASERYRNLVITNVDVYDQGYYFVKQTNERMFKDYKPFYLQVTVPISIVVSPLNFTVPYGRTVVFTCLVTGYPVSDIFWLHNGLYRRPNTAASIDMKTYNATLTIDNVTELSVGVYQCVAESRNNIDQNLLDSMQQATSLIINEMTPRLVSQVPAVPVHKSYATVLLTSDIRVECQFNATPKPSIEWYIDDNSIPIDESISVVLSERGIFTIVSSLQINVDKIKDGNRLWKFGGMLVAMATNNFGTAICKTLVFVDGELRIRDPGKITLKHGQPWLLKCYVVSGGVPEITWSKIKNGVRTKFPETHLERESPDRREIRIERVEKSIHEASYECSATLDSKKVSRTLKVHVQIPLTEIVHSEETAFLQNGQFIERHCKPSLTLDKPWYSWWEFHPEENKSTVISPSDIDLSISHGLSVTWGLESEYRYGYPPLPKGVPYFLRQKPNTFGKIKVEFCKSLPIVNLTCVIRNKDGFSRKRFRIMNDVIEFDKEPMSTSALVGSTVVLNCSAKPNHLNTTLLWQYRNTNVSLYEPGMSDSIYRYPNGTLVIHHISEENALEYLCLISSTSTSSVRSKLVKISLKVPARIEPLPGELELIKGMNYNVTCIVHGDTEMLVVEWWREEHTDWAQRMNIQRSDNGHKVTQLALQFFYVTKEDAGRYKCQTKNEYNKDYMKEFVLLTVVEVPGPVEVLGDIIPAARTMSATWLEPSNNGNKSIINYSIVLTSGDELMEYNVTGTHIIIDQLRPSRSYNVSIRARNAVGVGEARIFRYMTEEAVPDGPVQRLEARATSSTSVIVTWAPPDSRHQNGRILQYRLCHRRMTRIQFSSSNNLDSHSESNVSECNLINGTRQTFIDLKKFTGYLFRVFAINSKGQGPGAFSKESTWEDFPDLPPKSITCQSRPTTILLQWNPPLKDSINGILLKYTYKYFRVDYSALENAGSVDDVAMTKVTLENLHPYSNYSIQVAVVNKKGSGPMSAPVLCATTQGAPYPPEKVKVIWVNNTSVLVVWFPPLVANGVISYYCINYTNGGHCFIASRRQLYFKKLINGLRIKDKYEFRVTAYTNQPGPATLNDPIDVSNKIVSIPRDIAVNEGASVVLDCETIDMLITPAWVFYQNDPSTRTVISPRDYHGYHVAMNGSLVIAKVNYTMTGVYECTILSNTQSIKYSLLVTVVTHGIPGRPDIYYHSASMHSVAISWRIILSPTSGDPIRLFSVTCESIKEKSPPALITAHNVSSTERSFTVSDLQCGARYKLSLYSVNRVGRSAPETLTFRTAGTRPQWANGSGLLVSRHSRALCFNLHEFLPGHGCGPDKYSVTLSTTGLADLAYTEPHSLIQASEVRHPCNNVTNLSPHTGYHYKVEAINSAGSTSTTGYNTTLSMSLLDDPSLNKSHRRVLPSIFKDTIFYVVIAASFVIFIMPLGLVAYCLRRYFLHKLNPRPPATTVTNPRPITISNPISRGPVARRFIKLPDTPQSTYDTGEKMPNINEVDEELQPYMTYVQSQPTECNQRVCDDKHAYQYPDMDPGGSHQPGTSTSIRRVDNSLKQPLLSARTVYDIGCPRVMDSHEQYRASDSIMSGATGSSTKELAQVFQRNYNLDPSISLRESESSGDDPGIQIFTKERCPGQQAVEPQFTHAAVLMNDQSGLGPSSGVISHLVPHQVPFSGGTGRFPIRPDSTVAEEDESGNYQNDIWIV